MKISGTNVLEQPVDKVWDALLDPRVLVATIPGCERLVATGGPGDHAYDMTVTAGVAAIKGTYQGQCTLSDLDQHRGLTMRLSGAGAPGTIDATVQVSFTEPSPGATQIAYEADAVVGGMVGGVGQRMLTSVSKRMAGEFFGNVGQAITSGPVVEPVEAPTGAGPADAPGVVFARPGVSTSSTSGDGDFLKGIAVGAGLVVLGVIVGRVFGRR
ncbi:SRPBCC family protein [Nocardioides mangrovi]|uniref:Carbon monoxide dehydrogenase subunit G n=1 Tax=Nocardioides mangrovi TaxID=2874580 RepID=A0ABS7U8T2_9ACTN|nr:carbon monoxide dehydrogenase subunit G [Nocardioides mangrovi]MBZ5737255.1 carbon monoxide dehydrogenase subunit G [Nocardioides mangrovi]